MLKKVRITSMNLLIQLIEPVIKAGKYAKFTVVGNSMYPILRSNIDNVTVAKYQSIKKYDVILYKRENGEFVLHRVVGTGKLGYKLCGDNQVFIEYPVKKENVIAVLTSFQRRNKEISVNCWWYKLYCFLWCLVLPVRPLALKIILFIKKIFTRSNSSETEKSDSEMDIQ